MSTGSPRTLAGVSKHDGVLVIKPQLFEVLHLGTRQFPLLPQKCAQSPHDPAIELFEELLA